MKAHLRIPHNSTDINICDELTDELIAVVKNDNRELALQIVELINSKKDDGDKR